jgi:hypothetical protein
VKKRTRRRTMMKKKKAQWQTPGHRKKVQEQLQLNSIRKCHEENVEKIEREKIGENYWGTVGDETDGGSNFTRERRQFFWGMMRGLEIIMKNYMKITQFFLKILLKND